jgi:hypothetical protein
MWIIVSGYTFSNGMTKSFGIVESLLDLREVQKRFKVLFAAKPTKYLKNKIILNKKAALQ